MTTRPRTRGAIVESAGRPLIALPHDATCGRAARRPAERPPHLSAVSPDQVYNGDRNTPRDRKSIRELGKHDKEYPVKIRRIVRLDREDRCCDLAPDEVTIERYACPNSEQRTDENVGRIVDAEIYPSQ